MQQRKFRNLIERDKIRSETMMSALESGMPDEIMKQLSDILDTYIALADKPGELKGSIPLPMPGRVLEYFLPGRRVHQAMIRVGSSEEDTN